MTDGPGPGEPVVQLGPPVSEVAWSPDFVAQTLEVLIVYLDDEEAAWLKPVHAEALRVGLPVSAKPGEVVLETLGWYGLAPRVVHSTSWRHEDGRVVLTYMAVIEPPPSLEPDTLSPVPVERTGLARGETTAPPSDIGVTAVLEHALRHLAWLVKDDPAIAAALPDWVPLLDPYEPEPFRALG